MEVGGQLHVLASFALVPTEQMERTQELAWIIQTRQSLVSACNYNTIPHYTDWSVQASHENISHYFKQK